MRSRRTYGRLVSTVSAGVSVGSVVALIIMASVQNEQADTGAAVGGAIRAGMPVNQYAVPPCAEDQVISRTGRCLYLDDTTTYFRSSNGKAVGYWYDTRHPGAVKLQPTVPACYSDHVITRRGRCSHITSADYRGGYWYRTN